MGYRRENVLRYFTYIKQQGTTRQSSKNSKGRRNAKGRYPPTHIPPEGLAMQAQKIFVGSVPVHLRRNIHAVPRNWQLGNDKGHLCLSPDANYLVRWASLCVPAHEHFRAPNLEKKRGLSRSVLTILSFSAEIGRLTSTVTPRDGDKTSPQRPTKVYTRRLPCQVTKECQNCTARGRCTPHWQT